MKDDNAVTDHERMFRSKTGMGAIVPHTAPAPWAGSHRGIAVGFDISRTAWDAIVYDNDGAAAHAPVRF